MLESTRKTAVANHFYPNDCKKLKKMFTLFAPHTKLQTKHKPRAIIVPHAGYTYSGFTANVAYIHASKHKYKRIIVLGPSHRHIFKGMSASYYEEFESPCGVLKIDSAYLFALAKKFKLVFAPRAHQKEHSTEVQMPFIKYYFPHTPVVELIYGDVSQNQLSNLVTALLKNEDNLVVISSDLSHYYPLKKAEELDNTCMQAIKNVKESHFGKCEACGLAGLKAIINASEHLTLHSKLLHYSTSANYSKDEKSVVGYASAMIY